MAASGKDVAALRNRAAWPDHLYLVRDAFSDLSGDRQVGMGGASAIPFASIRAWADSYSVPPSMFPYFHRMLKILDQAFMAWQRDQAPSPSGS